ncbi:MAG: hypothetical protein ACO1OF_18315 [Adhaeribacter sp.]
MKERVNLKTIIISALVTGIFTVLTTLGINYFTSKQKSLTYSTQTSIPFEKDSLKLKILNFDLYNDGDEPVENIFGLIEFKGQFITDYKVNALPTLSYKEILGKNEFKMTIVSLNPREKVSISFLLGSTSTEDSVHIINFRAKGLFASKKVEGNTKNGIFSINIIAIVGLISILAGLFSSFTIFKIKTRIHNLADNDTLPKNLDNVDPELHSQNQNMILAYLCGIHGLFSEAEKYLESKTKVNYWSEADYFGNFSWLNKDDADNKKRLLVLIDLLDYANIAEDSKAIIYYNISKIHKVLSNNEGAKEFIQKAKGILPKLIDKRLKLDKQFVP